MRFFGRKRREPELAISIDEVNSVLSQAATTYREAPWIATFQAWIVGGSVAANGALGQIPELRDRWHATEGQALGVLKVFSGVMASHWARAVWTPKMTGDERRRNLENGLNHVIDFFGGHVESETAGFLALDLQVNADMDVTESGDGIRVVANELSLSLAASELSRPLPVALGVLGLPVDSTRELAERGWDFLCTSPESVVVGPVLTSEAAAKMFEWYKDLTKNSER